MTEHESTPENQIPTREQVVEGFKKFVAQGVTNPDDLPLTDPEVIKANNTFYTWVNHEQARATENPDPAAYLEFSLSSSTVYTDAGFSDPDYIDVVANDWLIQDLDRAEADGLTGVAAKIQAKIDELDEKLKPTQSDS